ncbi:MAG TPA: hypothetical protein V6C97_05015 [Oculatellaceae cyanobacterium]
MNELKLTKEERVCLQGWFRQAIAQLEVQEATAQFIKSRQVLEGKFDGHKATVTRRRAKRSTVAGHAKEVTV